MYQRYLNNNDYLRIITPEALNLIIRNDETRFSMAEEAVEITLIEYLTENYEIEKELIIGESIAPYNRQITYPTGVHIYFDRKILEVIFIINAYKAPASHTY